MMDKHGREQAAEPPAGAGSSRRRRRWPWVVAGVALALALTVVLLPSALSLGPGRRLVLGMINRRLAGSLEVTSWSLSWLSGFELNGVEFRDAGGNSVLRAASARVPASFFMLYGRKKSLGEVEISAPQVTLVRPDKRVNVLEVIARWLREAKRTPLPFDLKGSISITDGTISVRQSNGPATILSAVNGKVTIEGLDAPIRYSFEGALDGAGSPLKLSGSVNAFDAGAFDPDAVTADAELSTEGLDLAAAAPLARQIGMPVDFSGRLSGQVTARIAGRRQVTASGRVAVSSLQLSGGPLGEDRPAFEKADLEFNAGLQNGQIELKELRLQSPVGHAELSAVLPLEAPATWSRARIQAAAALDVAALGARMPHLMRLQEGLAVSEGTCDLQAAVSGSDQGLQFEGSIRLEHLAALRRGERIAAEAPIVIEVRGALTEQGPRLDAAKVESAFATAQASGTLESFSLEAAADLAALTREASKFVDLGGLSVAGSATARMSSSPAGSQAPAERRWAAHIAVSGLQVDGLAGGPLALNSLTVDASALAALRNGWLPREAREIRIEARGDAATATLAVERAGTPGPLRDLKLAGISLDAEGALARLAELGGAMGFAPGGLTISGSARTRLTGSLAGGVLETSDFEADVQDFTFSRNGRNLALPTVRLTGALSIDLASRSLRIRTAELTAAPARITIADVVIPDWTRPAGGITGNVTAEADLAWALGVARSVTAVPEGLEAAGRVTLSGSSAPASAALPGDARVISARAEVRDWRIRRPAGTPIAGELLEVECTATATPQAGSLPLRADDLSVKARSPFATLGATAQRIEGGPSLGSLQVTGLTADATASLGPLTHLAQELGLAPADLSAEGEAHVACDGSLTGGIARIGKLDLVVQNLLLRHGTRELRQPEVRLSASGEARLAERGLTLTGATLTSPAGTLRAKGIRVADWAALPDGVDVALEGEMDLSALAESARAFSPLPDGVQVSGRLKLDCVLSSAAGVQQADVRASAESLRVGRNGPWQFAEDRIEIAAKASADGARQAAKLEELRVSSGLLELSAEGELSDWSGARKLTVQGKLTPDFERANGLIRDLTGKDLELKGKQERPFRIVTELGHPDWQTVLGRTTTEAGLYVEQARQPGLEARALALDVTTGTGGIQLALTGKVNEGELSFRPLVTVSQGKPVLTLPSGASKVLTGVQLTDELANTLLGRAVPLFRQPLKAQGAVNVEVSELRVPLEQGFAQKAVANGTLAFRGASLGSSGLLKEVLAIGRLGDKSVTVPDQQVGLRLSEGRFQQDRMTFNAGGYTTLASGSVGLDKSLAMLVELPLTRELAGSESTYELLKDETLKVRIGGTLDAPQVDRKTVEDNVRSLLQSAAFGLLRRSLER